MTTAFDPAKICEVKRKEKDGTSVNVSCPLPVVQYTRHTDGVDRFDQKRGMYSTEY